MNPPSNNHNIEPRVLGNSSSNINGVNSPQRKVLLETKLQRALHSPLMADIDACKCTIRFKVHYLTVMFISRRVACLLRKVVQEIERRISTQAEHLKNLTYVFLNCFFTLLHSFYLQKNNIFKAREEKYHSRIRVLEALASGTEEENEVS
ncbi:hypothetical protein ACSQ67_009367 [Phaseolus vulgaris]